jgi:integrase
VQFRSFGGTSIDRAFLKDFLAACDEQHWRRVFLLMFSSGLRTDEVRHMLCEKIDWEQSVYVLDPMVEELGWNTKNGRWRLIPILPQTKSLFISLWQEADKGGVLVRDRIRRRVVHEEPAFPSLGAMIDGYRESVRQFTVTRGQAPTPADQEKSSEQVFRLNGALPKSRIYREFRYVLKRMGADKYIWPHLTRHFAASQAHQSGVDRFVTLSVLGHADIATFDRYCEKKLGFMQKEWAKVLDDSGPVLDALAQLDSDIGATFIP